MTDETLALPAPREPLLLPAPEQPKLLPPPKSPGERRGAPDGRDGKGRRFRVLAIAAAAVLLLLLIGWFFHHRQASEAEQANQDARDLIPTVSVVDVKTSSSTSDLRLPGSISPMTEASLFARASGYLSARYVDIGDTVRRGQVVAEIDSPDLDQQVLMARQQLDQARSSVNDAKARVTLSQVSYDRLVQLIKDQAVAQQQVDQARQDLDTAKAAVVSAAANVGAQQANLQRLVVLQGYEKVRAPFDGIVTVRNIDVGALINASGANSASSGTMNSSSASSSASGSSSGSGSASSSATETQNGSGSSSTELFRIAQADRVRVFVSVPQENAAAVEQDTPANVFVQGFDVPFKGTVTRTAQSLDPAARTLLTEVQVSNPQHRLVSGMYAQVGFESPRRGTPLLIPGEAVMARADGLRVAVIEDLTPEERAKLPKPDPAAKKRRQKEREEKQAGKGDDKGDDKGGEKGGDKGGEKGDDAKGKGGGSDKADSGKGGQAKGGRGDSSDQDDQDPSKARRIRLVKVEVGRDYGNEIEVTRGLTAGMTIVANPGDDVTDGAIVIAHPRENEGQKQGQGQARGGGDRQQGGGGAADQDAGGNGEKDRSGASAAGSGGSTAPARGPGGRDAPPQGIGSPSMEAPTKGRH